MAWKMTLKQAVKAIRSGGEGLAADALLKFADAAALHIRADLRPPHCDVCAQTTGKLARAAKRAGLGEG